MRHGNKAKQTNKKCLCSLGNNMKHLNCVFRLKIFFFFSLLFIARIDWLSDWLLTVIGLSFDFLKKRLSL
jgi:hypothetical protein